AGAPDGRVEAVRQYGRDLGFAFQVVDDVLDATATSEELGKTAGKDARQQKATFATVYGNEEALSQARNWAAQAVDRLTAVGIHSNLRAGLAEFVVSRRS
ncbi:MAG TPA: polyprenyl synthetase family protein, partial [Vicinamibacterales bacterium]|nr:polyprenyl synthetase family protein [Vicinamibacterales bacterium]